MPACMLSHAAQSAPGMCAVRRDGGQQGNPGRPSPHAGRSTLGAGIQHGGPHATGSRPGEAHSLSNMRKEHAENSSGRVRVKSRADYAGRWGAGAAPTLASERRGRTEFLRRRPDPLVNVFIISVDEKTVVRCRRAWRSRKWHWPKVPTTYQQTGSKLLGLAQGRSALTASAGCNCFCVRCMLV